MRTGHHGSVRSLFADVISSLPYGWRRRPPNRLGVRSVGFNPPSKSLVARGRASGDTAYSPITRYLALAAFEADKSSLKSGNTLYLALHRIQLSRNFGHRSHAFVDRAALPITVLVQL